MVLHSYAATEFDGLEESEKALTLKPMVLPLITLALKKAWKANQEQLEQAKIFQFLCCIQSATKAAYVEEVTQFIQIYSSEAETAQVKGRTIDFSAQVVARQLRLLANAEELDNMPGLTKKQYVEMFKGEFPRSPRGCQLDKAKPHWKAWLKFVNDYLVFRPQKDMMTQKITVAALHTCEGK